MNNLVLLLEEDGVDEAEDAEDDDADVDGERGHGLVAEVHVAAAEAVDHVGDGLVAVEVLLVGVLEPGPQLLEAPALGLLRQRPVVEPPRLLPAQHVVRLPQPDEPLRRLPQRQRRRVRVVLLGQPPVRRLYLLDVRLRFHPQELVVRLGWVVDEVGEPPTERLLLPAAAAVLLGVPADPPFVRVRPVYPRVHRLLLPLRRRPSRRSSSRGRLRLRRAPRRHRDDERPPAPAPAVDARSPPVEERRERGGCRGRRHARPECSVRARGGARVE